MLNELAKAAWSEREMESTRWQSRQQRGSRVVVGSDEISSPCTQYDGTKFCRQAWSGPNEDPSKGHK